MAVEPDFVEQEMKLFFSDIEQLVSQALTTEEVFYFASLIHLRFAHIHPFRDGNGRSARLLEKWFVTEKLGQNFWKMPSEEYYKMNQAHYYDTINLRITSYNVCYTKLLR